MRDSLRGTLVSASALLGIALVTPTCAAEDGGGAEVTASGGQGLEAGNGLQLKNGLALENGLLFDQGPRLSDGTSLSHGLAVGHGLGVDHGLATEEGLSSTAGFLTSEAGQGFVRYLVECALPKGRVVTKNDPLHGGALTFNGFVGLSPEWEAGACGQDCQEWVTACLLARTNALGQSVSIELVASHPAIGSRRTKPFTYLVEEAGFHGNLFLDPPETNVCTGSLILGPALSALQTRMCGLLPPLTCGFDGLLDSCALLGECSGRDRDAYVGCKNDAGVPEHTITTYSKLL